jgi:signal transduction histidine kinase/DNA-binding NarL/FixJ family response regulator
MQLAITQRSDEKAYVAIVDDLEVNRSFLEKLSQNVSEISAVRTFGSAELALDSFIRSQPDLIITDFSMPMMDAAAFLQRLRNIPGLEETPVIVVSANEKADNRRRALLSGATDFLTTPFDVFEFRVRVRNLLRLGLHQKFLRTNSLSLKQKLTETRLRSIKANQERREQLMNVIDCVPAIIFAVNKGLECVFTNQYCFEFFGGPMDPSFRALINRLARTGASLPEPAEVMVKNRKGEECTFLFMRRNVPRSSMAHDFAVYSGIDISTLKRTEESLRVAKRQAEAASEAKSAFLASMSHEIRTPLNAIIGFSDIICSEIFGPIQNPQYCEYIKDILNSANHLLSIIDEILCFSQIQHGQIDHSISDFCLEDCISGVQRMLTEELLSHKNRIEFESRKDFTLRSDPKKLTQVLLNVIRNSNNSMRGGAIHIDADQNLQGGITISVEDQGIGMTEEELLTAISEFGRIENPELSSPSQGMGLGLPLSSRFMSLLGGKLEISSKKGVGTRVDLILPASAVVQPALPDAQRFLEDKL